MNKRAKSTIGIIGVLVLVAGGLFVWGNFNGRFSTKADGAILGCQGVSTINNFLGRPGTGLISYDLFGNTVSISEKIKPFLDNVQKEVNAAKTGYIFSNVTTYNNRPKIWGGGRSLHSWGIAIDINPAQNPYQRGNYGAPIKDIPDPVIEIFKHNGFFWGGDWPGERDAMHFEWYGGELSGSVIDSVSGQKVGNAVTLVDGAGTHIANGDYDWTLPYGTHKVTVKAVGYEDTIFDVDTFCFENRHLDITMKALPENTPGKISGKVTLAGGTTLLMPATISIDGQTVGASNLRGEYLIPNVRQGEHKVEAKILFYPGASGKTQPMKPGQEISNFNLMIGQQ